MRSVKERHMDQLEAYVRGLYRKPQLRQLFLELTLQCNERCFHCGSSCTPQRPEDLLSLEEYKAILDQVKEDFDLGRLQLCITGGEPLLRPDFFEILGYAHELGYHWGMTSNATLITPEVAHRLAEVGMDTISVSIDGLPETHDKLRGTPGGYERAMRGIQALIDEKVFKAVQVTTVVNHENIGELDALFAIMDKLDIDSWRVINLEPIGRALQWPSRMLTDEDYLRRAHAVCPVTAVQNRYSMMARWHEKLFPVLEELNIGYVAFSPLANGLLSDAFSQGERFDSVDYRSAMPQYSDEAFEQNRALLQLIRELAAQKGATPAQISLAWMLGKKPYIVPIPGSRKVERIRENLGAADVSLTTDEVSAIDERLNGMEMSAVFGGSPVRKD